MKAFRLQSQTLHLALVLLLCVAGNSHGQTSASDTDLAIRGFSPVAYFTQGKPVRGVAEHQSRFNGYVYYFTGPDEKKLFDAEPLKYAPQFAGLCTTALGGMYGNRIPGDPEVFAIIEGRLFLFSSERAKRSFDARPHEFVDKAARLYTIPALKGYCPASYQMYGEARLGNHQAVVTHRDAHYRLTDDKALEAFKKDPDKYIPAYGGLCADAMSSKRRHAGDPTVFLVIEGRTFLFFDDAARIRFQSNPTENIKKADENWPLIKNDKPTIHP